MPLLYAKSPNWFYGFNFPPRCWIGSVPRLFIGSAWLHRDIRWDISVLFMMWESYWDSEITVCWQWKFILRLHMVLICGGLAACRPSAVCNMISSGLRLVSPLVASRKCSVRAFVLTTSAASALASLELFTLLHLICPRQAQFRRPLNVRGNCSRNVFIFSSTFFFIFPL